ncbi:hypothetical protein D9619_004551 [Psilocybe cf. subviscida]|uniref:Wax synthase domain-containing protein n=1 Tax=Psilocybe cf. subviscida TaxID=2480587 RepID=A0A8H5BQP7_9AGAR|nr:hypothetical protein D9619_004551 [Psilocybe cf. subviscida]
MSWFSDLAPDLTLTRQPLSFQTFFGVFLPPILCYLITARLVLSKGTLPFRVGLLPVTVWTAYRASISVDLVGSSDDPEPLAYFNQGLLLMMTTLVIRACIWTFQREPYTRAKSSGSKIADAADLVFNLRGIGWTWSKGIKLPAETRNVSSTSSFLFATLPHALFDVFMFDLLMYSVQSFGPQTIGSPAGGSIFDMTLAFGPRMLRAGIISILTGFTMYFAIESMYLVGTFPAILVFRQSPEDWPPLFAQPWFSTSLNEFWSYRWHQLFRDNFISFGGLPVAFLTGSRSGALLGSFLASGLLHYLGQWGMARGSDFLGIGGFFIMMGVGTLLERRWKKATGYPVRGILGWLWTFTWVSIWGLFLVEGWVTRGLGGSYFMPDGWRPGVFVVEKLKSLHTVS